MVSYLKIIRKLEIDSAAFPYDINVDGEDVGEVKVGKETLLEIPPGHHFVRIFARTIGNIRYGSDPFELDIVDGTTVTLKVGSRNPVLDLVFPDHHYLHNKNHLKIERIP
jgi:hypothetical protein